MTSVPGSVLASVLSPVLALTLGLLRVQARYIVLVCVGKPTDSKRQNFSPKPEHREIDTGLQ